MDNDELTFWNTLNYIKDNYVQFLLLLLVFIIIYTVDHISNVNALIFSIQSPTPGLQNLKQQNKLLKNLRRSKK
jgi:hypothetical protein